LVIWNKNPLRSFPFTFQVAALWTQSTYTYQQAAAEMLVENAAGTALVRQKQILTAGEYDAVDVDTSADPVFTITKKLGAATVDTKTITII
jgi:hypothetical protein